MKQFWGFEHSYHHVLGPNCAKQMHVQISAALGGLHATALNKRRTPPQKPGTFGGHTNVKLREGPNISRGVWVAKRCEEGYVTACATFPMQAGGATRGEPLDGSRQCREKEYGSGEEG